MSTHVTFVEPVAYWKASWLFPVFHVHEESTWKYPWAAFCVDTHFHIDWVNSEECWRIVLWAQVLQSGSTIPRSHWQQARVPVAPMLTNAWCCHCSNLSHSNKCAALPCGFHVQWPSGSRHWPSFRKPACHPRAFCREVFVQVSYPPPPLVPLHRNCPPVGSSPTSANTIPVFDCVEATLFYTSSGWSRAALVFLYWLISLSIMLQRPIYAVSSGRTSSLKSECSSTVLVCAFPYFSGC